MARAGLVLLNIDELTLRHSRNNNFQQDPTETTTSRTANRIDCAKRTYSTVALANMPEVPHRDPEYSDNTPKKRKREDIDDFSPKKKSRWGVLISQGELATCVNECAFILRPAVTLQ